MEHEERSIKTKNNRPLTQRIIRPSLSNDARENEPVDGSALLVVLCRQKISVNCREWNHGLLHWPQGHHSNHFVGMTIIELNVCCKEKGRSESSTPSSHACLCTGRECWTTRKRFWRIGRIPTRFTRIEQHHRSIVLEVVRVNE